MKLKELFPNQDIENMELKDLVTREKQRRDILVIIK
jgi:hypothetical protein